MLTSPSGPGYHIMLPFITTFKSVQVSALSLPWGARICPPGKLSPPGVLLGLAVSCSGGTLRVWGCHPVPACPEQGKQAQLPVHPPKAGEEKLCLLPTPAGITRDAKDTFGSLFPVWESGHSRAFPREGSGL